MEGCSEEALADKQALLNAKYDKFVERYGYITGKSNKMAFRDDSDYPLLCSLEEVNEEGEVKKADMFYKQTIKASIARIVGNDKIKLTKIKTIAEVVYGE